MRSTEYSVSVYERRLPDSSALRNAIIFHSVIPKVFLYYREALAFLIELCVPEKNWHRVESSAHKWSVPNDGKISFGSSTKSFKNTHYSHRNPSILYSDDNFIVPQGKNVKIVLTTVSSFLPSCLKWNITQHCTFTVSKPFTSLQFTVEGVKHTENSILTKQSSCPANLQLTAFKDFGTLRAGGYLQWRNIAMALENSFLDLNDPSVLQLLMQAMYQVGPTPVKENWNADLQNETFVATLCEYLHLVLTRTEPSWNAVITMQACISVACYVAEHANIEFANAPLQVLLRCRRIAKAWSQSIESQVSDSASDYDRAANYLVIINGLIVLTYGVFESATAVDVLLSESSLYDFLRARAKMCEFRSAAPTGTTVVLLRAGIRVSARFESEIQNLLRASKKPLDEVLFDTWNPRNVAGWSQCAGTLFWKTTCTAKDGTTSTVHFNVFDGTFLVDGEPAKGLPDRILHHPLFLRTFRRCRVSVFHRGGAIFETKKPLHSASFTFAEKAGNLIVREIFDGKSRALLDPEFFVKDLPGKLIVEQSHWVSLDPNDLDIQLRPVEITHPDFHNPNFVIKLDRSLEGQVFETETGRKMLNWAGNVFSRVYNNLLQRLEDKTHALPFLPNHCKAIPDKEWSLCVTLPRLRLHVEFLASSVRIREFEGMRVSKIQTVGTFFRLEKMLVLESEGGGRTVLVPNIDLCFRSQHPHHLFVKDTWNIRNERIPVFAFTQDVAIRQLRPYGAENFTSWLMCAYLHAATSSAMPDPFTGLTGLEMAMIQLRRCYTNRPFDEASIDILERISNLSVKRSKAHGTYVTFWDHSRSAYANSDALGLLVNLLLRKNSLEERIPLDLTYNRRSYELYSWTYSPAALLNKTERSILKLARKKPEYPPFHRAASQDNILRSLPHSVRCQKAMSALKRTWNGFSWVQFLESFPTVSPVKKIGNHVGCWSSCQFSSGELWLSLYAKAVEIASEGNEVMVENFGLLLSFAAWKLKGSSLKYHAALSQLLLISMSKQEYHLIPQTDSVSKETVTNPRERFLRESSIDFHSCLPYSTPTIDKLQKLEYDYQTQKQELNRFVWKRVKQCRVWKSDGANLVPAVEYSSNLFQDIAVGFVVELTPQEKVDIVGKMRTYYKSLRPRQVLHEFAVALDNFLQHESTQCSSLSCTWDCSTEVHLGIERQAPFARATGENESFCYGPRLRDDISRQLLQTMSAGKNRVIENLFEGCVEETPEVNGKQPVFTITRSQELEGDPIGREFLEELNQSCRKFRDSMHSCKSFILNKEAIKNVTKAKAICENEARRSWGLIETYLNPTPSDHVRNALKAAGVLPPITPRTLFPLFGEPERISKDLAKLLEVYLVYTVYLQKAHRCFQMLEHLKTVYSEHAHDYSQQIVRDLLEEHCTGWTPEEHPKWLLFEVENAITLRTKQVRVALAIINGEHQVLQLNMGEGKTSVISPLVCATLADGNNAVRLTLLTSLLETHGTELAMRLGGLLNQPVYFFPCNRDMNFDAQSIDKMKTQFLDCISQKGCIVTAPEHRLSLLLKFEEICIRSKEAQVPNVPQAVTSLYELFQFHKTQLIDVLDEPDEVLRYKYQLLYAIGAQQAVDGSDRRWKVLQAVFQVLLRNADYIFGQSAHISADREQVIFQSRVHDCGKGSWPHVRLIDASVYVDIRRKLVELLLAGKGAEMSYMSSLDLELLNDIRSYLCENDSPQQGKGTEISERLKKNLSKIQWHDVLILRGLLTYEVLQFSLTKRWSVDYGVDMITNRRLMAVPFKGKDVPSDRTDFGHPDVALVLTHLSYYYMGLSKLQVKEAVEHLLASTERDVEYQSWLDLSPPESKNIPTGVEAINLADVKQIRNLAAFFRFNVATIHFWLNSIVLPQETKEFPHKLVASAWDLAKEQRQPVRGFSGTKDAHRLFPLQVSLGTLPELSQTDGEVVYRITNPENRRVYKLSFEVDSKEVVQKMLDCGEQGSVLIDAGALMVGMSNIQVAHYWLEKAPVGYLGAVYFEGNTVMIVLRDGHRTKLDNSPLKKALSKVLVYMDDIHTRGTDFKFPIPTRAFVTLGRNLPKDKFVQACLRMRRLGEGHSACFLAPGEVYRELSEIASGEPSSEHILQWCIRNTVCQLREGIIQWAQQGFTFARREAATRLLERDGNLTMEKVKVFAGLVKIPEITKLEDLYEPRQGQISALEVVGSGAKSCIHAMEEIYSRSSLRAQAERICLQTVESLQAGIESRCQKYVPSMQVSTRWLDEEQERELEQELLQERQVSRPPDEEPFVPVFPEGLIEIIQGKEASLSFTKLLAPLWDSLQKTTVYPLMDPSCFDERFVTTDNFRQTMKFPMKKQDEFVRPPRWILVLWKDGRVHEVILLSPFEANIAIRALRGATSYGASLHRFAPRTRRDQEEPIEDFGLTSWAHRGIPSDPAALLKELRPISMVLSMFGSSTCLTNNPGLPTRSLIETCRFLSVAPPPSVADVGLSPRIWQRLRALKLISADGFIPFSQEEFLKRLPEDDAEIAEPLREVVGETKWRRSPVPAAKALVAIRNLEPWFSRSDLSSVLLSAGAPEKS